MKKTRINLSTGKPLIMGIVNVTPNSFSDGGNHYDTKSAVKHGLKLLEDGADILDIGGESTKPGAEPVSVKEEISRVIPVIKELSKHTQNISLDTRNAQTMRVGIEAGANIINDISALTHDKLSVDIIKQYNIPIILMHMQNTPVDMQKNPHYNNTVEEIFKFFQTRITYCKTHGIDKKNIIIDPGIGFGKTLEHNLLILRNIKKFQGLGCPIMLGSSRKSFIQKIDKNADIHNRLGGSLSSVIWGLSQGVKLFRVHDVKETKQAIDVYRSISEAGSEN